MQFIPVLAEMLSQDLDLGGIADRPGDQPDVFHTHFGVAGSYRFRRDIFRTDSITGLSLLGYPGLEDIDPVYCMPARLIRTMGLQKDWQALPRRS